MKFRYYFLSFTLIMLAIYGLHVGYVYYFVENPFAFRTQWEHAMSFHFGSGLLTILLVLMLSCNLPIWFYSFKLINQGNQNPDDVAGMALNFFGNKFRFAAVLLSIIWTFVFVWSDINIHTKASRFTLQDIDYMVNNLQTKQVVFEPDVYKGDNPSLQRHYVSMSLVQFPDKDWLVAINCSFKGRRNFCQAVLNQQQGTKATISYFEHKYISKKTGRQETDYILFSIEGEKNRNTQYYQTLYKSELKAIKSARIIRIALCFVALLFNLIIHFKVKKYVINW